MKWKVQMKSYLLIFIKQKKTKNENETNDEMSLSIVK